MHSTEKHSSPVAGRTEPEPQEDTLRERLDRVTGQRVAAWLDLAQCRTELATLRTRVVELEQAAEDHPSQVDKLTAEAEYWADRCGGAEADLEALTSRAEAVVAAWDDPDLGWGFTPKPLADAVRELRAAVTR
jgi:hypothetical protein